MSGFKEIIHDFPHVIYVTNHVGGYVLETREQGWWARDSLSVFRGIFELLKKIELVKCTNDQIVGAFWYEDEKTSYIYLRLDDENAEDFWKEWD